MIIKIKLLKGRLCENFVGSDVDDGGQTSVVLLIHHQPSLLLPWADSETSEESTQAASPPHTMLMLHHLFSCLAFQTFYNIFIKSNTMHQTI